MIVDESILQPDIENIDIPGLSDCGVTLQVMRLDRVHPLAGGNKIYKLHGWLQKARRSGRTCLLSIGGAHSNHLHALALSAARAGLRSAALVRFDANQPLTPTLQQLSDTGMRLEFIDAQTFRRRYETHFAAPWLARYERALWIPEGGSGPPGLTGPKALMQALNRHGRAADVLAVAAGSGGFAAGLLQGCENGQEIAAFAMPRDPQLESRIRTLAGGGGGKLRFFPAEDGRFGYFDAGLLQFAQRWHSQTGVLPDPVYTTRLFRRAIEHIRAGGWQGKRVCLVHSGGLQGWAGMSGKLSALGGQSALDWLHAAMAAEAAVGGAEFAAALPPLSRR
ncbi:pyridoxal-phosphate dependent enzyme [Granulosicoccaceae sp. 1_MG-2023]|nr:pyridoxal-phosphate dependent enzyme [Granulosicoccaceae sp. 1_MG-2023]